MTFSSFSKFLPLYRACRGKCPSCGKADLFYRYLKPYQTCNHCGQDYECLNADDGPAWLCIVIIGHIIIPLAILVQKYTYLSLWIQITAAIFVSAISVILLLPYAKGVFMGAIWMTKNDNEKKNIL